MNRAGGEEEQLLCAVYARLSKEDEEKRIESESIQNQKSILVRYALERGWAVYQIYCDEDYSGADSLRPDFNRMLEDARQGRFQVILCKSQSRFTRDMELVEKYIHGLFPLWGIRFIAVADNADTQDRGNKKARQINGLINEWYLEDLSENVRMVLDLKRREGQYIGAVPLYGYRKDPTDRNRLLVDPPAAAVVRRIFLWSMEGRGSQEIARLLNREGTPSPACYRSGEKLDGLWNKTTVWRILRNEMYTGVMIQGRRKKVSYKSRELLDVPRDRWYRVEGTHEAIIGREAFDEVQRSMGLRARSDGTGEAHLLSALVKCLDCGSTMSKAANGRKGQNKVYYLRCSRYAAGEGLCTRHSIRLQPLIEGVSERIRQYVRRYFTLERLEIQPSHCREALEQERKALTLQLERRSQALKSLYLDKVSGTLSEAQFLELNEAFQRERSRLEQRLTQLEEEAPSGGGDLMERARGLLKLRSVPRELVVRLIEQIEIGERDPESGCQEVKITWRF
ncbi:recombinase family protein [Oscillibacter hominis]|uniref:Recombinase family protein n=1 Tax=Oscillibacter hominis TaxID=2763056 RepID=A0A7G9B1C1_9FIRM|nr:recombinase family protein [Oscillibacter hominis]QNL43352.1 recombinase family protein [Oscillibacter hominis]